MKIFYYENLELYGIQKSSGYAIAMHVYIIIRLQKLGVYGIYNPKALSCGTLALLGRY